MGDSLLFWCLVLPSNLEFGCKTQQKNQAISATRLVGAPMMTTCATRKSTMAVSLCLQLWESLQQILPLAKMRFSSLEHESTMCQFSSVSWGPEQDVQRSEIIFAWDAFREFSPN